FARVNAAGTTQDVSLGALPTGYHLYKVKPVTGGYQFYVDNVLQATLNVTFPNGTALKIALSAFNGSPQPPLQADWIRIDSYPASGTFISATFDAGRTATWGTVGWTATVPSGTTMVIESSSSVDGVSWSAWASASNGGTNASPSGRYLRYRITFTTPHPTSTAVPADITFNLHRRPPRR